ncbi:hypothetical protein PILCRDRAFT_136626 [Piloderma croceum F 1598]|uniref:Uncharacterized protein n=1 Tax=Piloderma croceum (strain F 1598) TaxID=765440 RepID=A0A0C3G629_PILCF|nr:hypothetical protein PILCRDRAFT_136626 [Piloderma croceum F 1598]
MLDGRLAGVPSQDEFLLDFISCDLHICFPNTCRIPLACCPKMDGSSLIFEFFVHHLPRRLYISARDQIEMKKLYSRLKSKHRSNSPSGSDPSDVAGSSSIASDQTCPTYGIAVVSGQPVETIAGPDVSTQGHSSGSVPQGPRTTSALLIAADTATAVAAPVIPSHDSQRRKHDADTPVPATSPSERAQNGRLAYNAATEILPLIQAAAGAIPVAGSPMKAVIGGLLQVMNALDRFYRKLSKIR